MNREQIKEKMVSAMDLPKDVIQNASVITILGRNELCIENYRGIHRYTDPCADAGRTDPDPGKTTPDSILHK
mgnify:CR=1 FL=1